MRILKEAKRRQWPLEKAYAAADGACAQWLDAFEAHWKTRLNAADWATVRECLNHSIMVTALRGVSMVSSASAGDQFQKSLDDFWVEVRAAMSTGQGVCMKDVGDAEELGSSKRLDNPESILLTQQSKKRAGSCFRCGKQGHFASECRASAPKDAKRRKGNDCVYSSEELIGSDPPP